MAITWCISGLNVFPFLSCPSHQPLNGHVEDSCNGIDSRSFSPWLWVDTFPSLLLWCSEGENLDCYNMCNVSLILDSILITCIVFQRVVAGLLYIQFVSNPIHSDRIVKAALLYFYYWMYLYYIDWLYWLNWFNVLDVILCYNSIDDVVCTNCTYYHYQTHFF